MNFNNSPYYQTQQHQQSTNNSKRLNDSLSSSSNSSTSSILSNIKPTSFHDYTFSQDHFPHQNKGQIHPSLYTSHLPLSLLSHHPRLNQFLHLAPLLYHLKTMILFFAQKYKNSSIYSSEMTLQQ